MLSQSFCYCGKQQSADNNIIQFHLTLKCTKYQSCYFFDFFLTQIKNQIQINSKLKLTQTNSLPETFHYWDKQQSADVNIV